jgi:hypothetical protein
MSLKDVNIAKVKPSLSLLGVKVEEPLVPQPHPPAQAEEDPLLLEAEELFYTMEETPPRAEYIDPEPILRYFKPGTKLYALEDEFICIKGGSNRLGIVRYIDGLKRQEKAPDKAQEGKLEELVKSLREEVWGKPKSPTVEPPFREAQSSIFK